MNAAIERAARALCCHAEANCWETHVDDVRTVLKAIREPTQDQKLVAKQYLGLSLERDADPLNVRFEQAYTAMIDVVMR